MHGSPGQQGTDGLQGLLALVHLVAGQLGVIGVDRPVRLVDVLEDLRRQQGDLPAVLLAQGPLGLAGYFGTVAALGAISANDRAALRLVVGRLRLLLPPRRTGEDQGHGQGDKAESPRLGSCSSTHRQSSFRYSPGDNSIIRRSSIGRSGTRDGSLGSPRGARTGCP